MKNNRIIDAWDKIEPDSAADERMLGEILARNKQVNESNKGKAITMRKTLTWKRLAPAAACLILVVAIAAIIGNNSGRFGDSVYAVELDGGTLSFHKTDSHSMANFDFGGDAVGRDLTAEENSLLFTNLSVTSHGLFDASANALLHVESRTGNTKIILSAHDVPVTDTMIETNRTISEINGVQVSAGYFITRENSRGERNIIYIASFDIDGVQIYVESGGSEDMSDEIRAEIASVIETLINSGAPANIPFVYLLGDRPQLIGHYVTENASVFLYEDNTFALHGPAEISHTPSGTYTSENGVLTLLGTGEQVYTFLVAGDTLVFERGVWLENWIEPGTVFIIK